MRWSCLMVLWACAEEAPSTRTDPTLAPGTVRWSTSAGELLFALDRDAAPRTVDNLVAYVDAGFYDGADGDGATVLHRAVPGFVVQGGGFTVDLAPKAVGAPVPYEGDNGLRNVRGTVAMARQDDPDSATTQWFVNLVDNRALDHTEARAGYAVFGELVEGLDVLDRVARLPTSRQAGLDDVPVEPVVVLEVLRAEALSSGPAGP